jgi:hypothetical protein
VPLLLWLRASWMSCRGPRCCGLASRGASGMSQHWRTLNYECHCGVETNQYCSLSPFHLMWVAVAHLKRQLLPVRPGRCWAMSPQFLGPCCCTSAFSASSSCARARPAPSATPHFTSSPRMHAPCGPCGGLDGAGLRHFPPPLPAAAPLLSSVPLCTSSGM